MAISLLQDAQTRSLAAALAGIKRDDVDRSLSLSPPMSANSSSSSLYPGLQQAAAASAFGMLSPSQLLAANRQAAAAFMAAQLPMSTLASTLFPHHPALFGSWSSAAGAPHMTLTSAQHSPPASPHSPVQHLHNNVGSNNNNINNNSNSNNIVGKHTLGMISPTAVTQQELPAKKPRKLSVKKEFNSTPMELNMNVGDLYNTSGPISPPSSGSSPNSTHDASNTATAHNKDTSRDKSFTCKICSRSFGYKHVLQNHERTHTGEKPFECPECHKRFTRDHHLKTHMRLHTGEKPYHCSHCDRQFVQVANLRRHLRVHTGERPYTCEVCEGKFSDSNQLKSHMLVHNGEKPFECERCQLKFRRRHHLLNHKCGINSPPTPAVSPAISNEYAMCEQKANLGSSYGSEESIDLHKPSAVGTLHFDNVAALAESSFNESPLDLSENDASSFESALRRKAQNIKRVFRMPAQIMHVHSDMPEQTEPEDLSVRHQVRISSNVLMERASAQSPETMMSLHEEDDEEEQDIDLDELDDAATLYLRQQQLAAMKRHIKIE